MLLLASTSDKIRLTTSAATNVDVQASYVDLVAPSTVTPGRLNTAITTATTTDVVASPGASTFRTLKLLSVRNKSTTTANDVTVIHTDGTTAVEVIKVTLLAGEALIYDEHAGFLIRTALGAAKTAAATGQLNIVPLTGDVTNNNASANTIADVTGLTFPVLSGVSYYWKAAIGFTAAATTTGSRWAVNGPASPTHLAYTSRYPLTATTETFNYATAYDIPAAANATSLTTGNVAVIEGVITPSADGTVAMRFASEISSSAIVAKTGSVLQWMRAS